MLQTASDLAAAADGARPGADRAMCTLAAFGGEVACTRTRCAGARCGGPTWACRTRARARPGSVRSGRSHAPPPAPFGRGAREFEFGRRARAALGAALWLLAGLLLWVTKLLAVSVVARRWYRCAPGGPNDGLETRIADAALRRAGQRLDGVGAAAKEGSGAYARSVGEARERARRRATRVAGGWTLEMPRPDLSVDVAFINKLYFAELFAKTAPQTLVALGTALRAGGARGVWTLSTGFALLSLASQARYFRDMHRQRSWASSTTGCASTR